MEVNMVAVMEVDKVADMVAYMAADKEEKEEEKIADLLKLEMVADKKVDEVADMVAGRKKN